MIDIKNLCFSYTNKPPYILNDISLNLPKGIYLSIVGENGSCKTTLIKLILGLLKPTSGSIEIDSNSIGYVPQRLDSFNSQFPITVKEVLSCHKKTLKNNSIDIDSILKDVNMLDFKNRLLGMLSGGQQQRVLIARALMGNPDIIILDEPSTGVDENNQKEIYNILKKLNKENKKTIISIEHNLDIAINNSTHILRIENASTRLFTVNEFIEYKKNSFND
ncbi:MULTISPECIES: metal ABC transporter ATP-binding protein [unclassified Clostridium]|mgnify:CR=1 FL=1|uniref:metal ABC transporter ATP-binding protein n=2 Tax=Clostridium TaxID=1485 RepID=UPI0025BF9CDB|nr:metal ABC transporter ATP-binding protein [Clostridium sp.]MCI6691424.1 metal ABC transporter ATP-binding protein [Clostridium sp.]MDY2630289.1 metal ABC transporter ATP-binding protein [Clostridium sp.]MDY4253900.1 metal ABC transporter ATP-binding protein [Clostridium sp.]